MRKRELCRQKCTVRQDVCERARHGCLPPSKPVDVTHVIKRPTPLQLGGAIVLQQTQTGVIKAERGGGWLDGRTGGCSPHSGTPQEAGAGCSLTLSQHLCEPR